MTFNFLDIDKNENLVLQFLVGKRWFLYAGIKEISKESKKAWNTVSEAASSLEKKRLIKREKGILRINRDNIANYYFKAFIDQLKIQNLDEEEQSIISYTLHNAESITQERGSRIISLLIFGSVASGDAVADSDIDILVIIKHVEEKLPELKSRIITLKHIEFEKINLVTMTEKEFEKGYLEGDDLILSILSNNLLVKDDQFLWTFMQKELFMPSKKAIYSRIEQLENNKLKLIGLLKTEDKEELRKEFHGYLIRKARIELLKNKILPVTKREVIYKIKTMNKGLYNEIMNVGRGDIKKKVLNFVSSGSKREGRKADINNRMLCRTINF